MRLSARRSTFLVLSLLTSCGTPYYHDATSPEPVHVATVTIQAATTAMESLGEIRTATASVLDSLAQPVPGRAIVWSSSNTAVATVTPDSTSAGATIAALSNGDAIIKATAEGISATINVHVAQVVRFVIVAPLAPRLMSLGDTVRLTAKPKDALFHDIAGRSVTWTSANPAISSVSSTGLATAIGNGVDDVAASVDGVFGSVPVAVRQVPTALAFLNQPIAIQPGVQMPALQVAVQDARGNTVTDATSTIGLALDANPSAAILSGLVFADAVAGKATFVGNAVSKIGVGYTLAATLTPAPGTGGQALSRISAPFEVMTAAARADSVVLAATTFTIGGANSDYKIWLVNATGHDLTQMVVQVRLEQGTTIRDINGFAVFGCGGSAAGVLPAGRCRMTAQTSVPGNQGWVPGPAVMVFEFKDPSHTFTSLRVNVTLQ